MLVHEAGVGKMILIVGVAFAGAVVGPVAQEVALKSRSTKMNTLLM
jgi:hypothetical protein